MARAVERPSAPDVSETVFEVAELHALRHSVQPAHVLSDPVSCSMGELCASRPSSRSVPVPAGRSARAPEGLEFSGSDHIMGTCRMGTNPATSVVNPDSRSWEHPNLYVIGSSVFPTGAASNPTLTVAALALRAADDLLTKL
jgi:choline dehydrogenase-like flavoprotein